MARNVEIKARVEALGPLAARARDLGAQGPTFILQDDTFFRCSAGRLKLRAFSKEAGELLFYRRADDSGPNESFYVRSQTPQPEALREALTLAYGVVGRVTKRRTLYLLGRTRVHLDEVDGLGDFLELEVVLQDGEAVEAGAREARELMERLGVKAEQLVTGSYLDLLAAAGR